MLPGNRSTKFLIILLVTTLVPIILWYISNNPAQKQNIAGTTAQPTFQFATPAPQASWLILPTFPSSATQADVGAEIYRLVCQDCHGDKGQGLTDEWRATWDPEDQNCWQSKCHASNYPPEGFLLPRVIPSIIGPVLTSRIETSLDLYKTIRERMPYHNPGSLTDEEYWQLTAFLVRENGANPMGVPLDESRAAYIYMQSNEALNPEPGWSWITVALISFLLSAGIVFAINRGSWRRA